MTTERVAYQAGMRVRTRLPIHTGRAPEIMHQANARAFADKAELPFSEELAGPKGRNYLQIPIGTVATIVMTGSGQSRRWGLAFYGNQCDWPLHRLDDPAPLPAWLEVLP